MKQETQSHFLKRLTISKQERTYLKEVCHGAKEKDATHLNVEALKKTKELFENTDTKVVVIELEDEAGTFFSYKELHALSPLVAGYFGELLPQNEKNDQVISVYDRDRKGSIWAGSRYHQTREGGSIHTDNVNTPAPWDYLFMLCISPAHAGGENILVNGDDVYRELKANYPEELETLKKDFIWEMRGLEDKTYLSPIIKLGANGEILFRHLRPYMESAHQKTDNPLSEDQLIALDTLDAITNSFPFQTRLAQEKGNIVIIKDSEVLHGRTCFSDSRHAVDIEHYKDGDQLKRTLDRIWIKRNN